MSELLVFGLGYSAAAYVESHGGDWSKVRGTLRTARPGPAGVEILPFDSAAPDAAADPRITAAIGSAAGLLVSAAPDANGDPMLQFYRDAIAAAPHLRSIVYLSTIGVYGDHQGALIDEDAELLPTSTRNAWRVEVERQWLELGRATGKAVHVLRLSGIYGPGRNPLVKLRDGTAHRIIREGQVFNRIHTADIAAAVEAAFGRPLVEQRVWNVTDSEPCAPQYPIEYAAKLLGVEPPPAIAFEDANLSPMARSFWGENKRVSNRRMREELGVTLTCPTYREGLDALAKAGEGR